jgi:4-amino-4-deoxychorismate lyase
MSLLLESIYLKDGVLRNLAYHEARMRDSLDVVFNSSQSIDISVLNYKSLPTTGLHKVRVVYDTQIRSVEIVPYEIRPVKSLKLVYANDVSYDHKFLDRTRLESLYSNRANADDILIVKNGLITDSFYANVIFKKAEKWFAPKSYLLKGTMRESLLDKGLVKEEVITIDNYREYESCKLINSMLGADGREISIEAIF